MGVEKFVFWRLLFELCQQCGHWATRYVSAEEQLAIFLQIAQTGLSNSEMQEIFQWSGDTISKYVATHLGSTSLRQQSLQSFLLHPQHAYFKRILQCLCLSTTLQSGPTRDQKWPTILSIFFNMPWCDWWITTGCPCLWPTTRAERAKFPPISLLPADSVSYSAIYSVAGREVLLTVMCLTMCARLILWSLWEYTTWQMLDFLLVMCSWYHTEVSDTTWRSGSKLISGSSTCYLFFCIVSYIILGLQIIKNFSTSTMHLFRMWLSGYLVYASIISNWWWHHQNMTSRHRQRYL